MGRILGSTLTEEKIARLCQLVREGNTLRAAGESVGYGWVSVRTWMALGSSSRFVNHPKWVSVEDADPLFRDFVVRVEEAEAHAKSVVTKAIFAGVKSDPNLALRIAMKRWPREWQPELYPDDEDNPAQEANDATATITLADYDELAQRQTGQAGDPAAS